MSALPARAAWRLLQTALLVWLLAACGGGSGSGAVAPTPQQLAPPLEPVRVVYSQASPLLLPYWVAQERELFARNGLRVELREERDAAAAYRRLAAGEIEVYLAPIGAMLLEQEELVLLGGSPELAIVANRRLLAVREAILERFLRATLEGIALVKTQPEAARAVLAQRLGPSTAQQSEAVVRARLLDAAPVPYLRPADVAAALPTADPAVAERLVDTAILQRLEASGFVAALYRA
jgi:ABC-type nitrate/sulfonate/bicarbonate transport system substrate-binding protein